MSGHSKWATIKRKKASTDAARGRAFTQVVKEITVAARLGGGVPDGNPRLRIAIDKAKAINMPAENIKRGIMKGTGELPGVTYEDITYEAYAPGGVALIIECLTDNKNRAVAEIRHNLEKNGGKLAAAGAVAYMFHYKGTIAIPKAKYSEDDILAVVLDAGADDMNTEGEFYEVLTTPDNFEAVKSALESKGITIESAETSKLPETHVKVEGKDAGAVLRIMEFLESHDDVQHVYANFDIDEKTMEEFGG